MPKIKVTKRVARNPRRVKRARRKRNVASVSATRAHRPRRRNPKRRRAAANPVPVIVTMGATNPRRKRRKTVAAKKRHRRNPAKRSAVSKRRSNPKVVTKRRRNRRNPPAVFGTNIGSAESLKMILGGLIGVTLTKTAVGMLPANLITNGLVRVVATGALAFGGGVLARNFGLGPAFADGVAFGGLMQAASTALTEFIPGGARIALSGVRRGVGDLVPAEFTLPNNPIKLAASTAQRAMLPPASVPSVTGMRQVFRPRF